MSAVDPPDNSPPEPQGAGAARANPVTSLSLLQRARARDQQAWQHLFHLYRPLVLYWCAHRGVRHENADDVAQEVFRAAAAGLDAFRRDRPGDTFRGWLRGITHNMVLLHFRRQRRQVQAAGGSDAQERLADVSDPLTTEADDPPEQISGLYRRALDLVRGEFTERTWQMFWQTVIDGRTTAAVAADLGVTDATVRQARSRILRRLKEEVGDCIA
jgi:RNA polymerase sigma-70 factor (ECF subfamily)